MYRFLRFPEGKSKAVTFSYDDGYTADLKIADMLTEYGMKGTFNLNSAYIGTANKMTKEEAEEHLISRGHEIALHTATHVALGKTTLANGILEMHTCKNSMEKTFGRIIRGSAYADSGIRILDGVNKEDIKSYLRALDVVYARSLAADNDSFELPVDFLEWIPTAHQTNPEIMNYIEKFVNMKVEELYCASRSPKLFYIWGHAFELDENLTLLRKICDKISKKEDTWYATNMEIYDYVMAYRSLVVSSDGRIYHNPTLTPLWIAMGGKIYKIKSGETIKI